MDSGAFVGVSVGATFSVGATVGSVVAGAAVSAFAAFAACVDTRVFFLTGVLTRVGVCSMVGMRVRVGRGVRVGCGVSVGAMRATLTLRGVRVGARVGTVSEAAGAQAAIKTRMMLKRMSRRGVRNKCKCKFNVLGAEGQDVKRF